MDDQMREATRKLTAVIDAMVQVSASAAAEGKYEAAAQCYLVVALLAGIGMNVASNPSKVVAAKLEHTIEEFIKQMKTPAPVRKAKQAKPKRAKTLS